MDFRRDASTSQPRRWEEGDPLRGREERLARVLAWSIAPMRSPSPWYVTGANFRAEGESEFGKCDLSYE